MDSLDALEIHVKTAGTVVPQGNTRGPEGHAGWGATTVAIQALSPVVFMCIPGPSGESPSCGVGTPLEWQNGAPPSYLPVGGIHTPVLLNVREGVTGFTYKNCDMGGNIGPKGTVLHTTMNICCGVR